MRPHVSRLRPARAARLVLARLALLAVLAAALVPGLSRVLQPGAAWGALCQSLPAARSTPADTPPAGRDHGDACAFCTLAHTTPALADGATTRVAVVPYATPLPPAPAAVRPRAARARAASARGPPAGRPILAA